VADNQIGTRARWTINSTLARNVQLKKLKNYSETDNKELEHVLNTAGEIAGEKESGAGGTLEFEYYTEEGRAEVDWRKLQSQREYFSLTKQLVGGERLQYTSCRVANVASEGDDEGSQMITVQIAWRARASL
jgi:hypothetical protein